MANVNDLKRSRFLTQRDIERDVLVTIAGYDEVNVAKEGAEEDLRWVLNFREFEKPLVLNSTNGQIIELIIGSGEFKDWIGHKIVLYVDPTISFGGKLVGGVRVRAPKKQTKPATTKTTKLSPTTQEVLDTPAEEDEPDSEVDDEPPSF